MPARSTISPTWRSPPLSASTMSRRVGSAKISNVCCCMTMHMHCHAYYVKRRFRLRTGAVDWGWVSGRRALARAGAGPAAERAREGGRVRESDEVRRLVHRHFLPVEIVQRHLVAQLIEKLFEGDAFRLELAIECRPAQSH